MTDAPEYLRAGEIARLSGVSVRTVRRWIAEGTLPSVKVRGVRLVSRKGFERVLLPAPPDWAAPEGEIEQEKAFRNIGKAHGENTSILYGWIPECHRLALHVTLRSRHPMEGAP